MTTKAQPAWATPVIYIIIAYLFSLAIRYIWVYQFNGTQDFIWNAQMMINTNDGYYFASAVEHLLNHSYSNNPQIEGAISTYPGMIYVTAFFVQFFSIPIETVILYMPALIGSLVVIPIILIGHLFKLTHVGFLAALLGSIAHSYYNRTMIGYYDSDMFAIMMQYFILYAFMAMLVKEKLSFAITVFGLITLYPYLYPQGLSLLFAMYLIASILLVWLHKNERSSYIAIALTGLALINISLFIKLPLAFSVFLLAAYKKDLDLKYWVYTAGMVFLLFLFYSGFTTLIYGKITWYLDRGVENASLQFFQVSQTVREAGSIPFSVMAERISGSTLGMIAAILGYGILLIRNKLFIITLPLAGIGIFSLWGGLRFTVYAVPIGAFAAVYFFYILASYIQNIKLRWVVITGLSALMLYPNIKHVFEYQVPTVLTAKEVQSLDLLKKNSSSKDYTIAWWDYGYPLWFYTNTNTLIDGGKHHHDNFIVSEILTTSSQLEAARLSRIAVETYVQSDYQEIADTLFLKNPQKPINVADYLDSLKIDTSIELPQKTREVYLYLPLRMLDILPTIALFSNLDLNAPDNRQQPFFYPAVSLQDTGKTLELGNNVSIIKEKNILKIGDQEIPIKQFFQVGYTPENKLAINKQLLASEGLNVIYLASYGRFLVMDDYYLNSTYIQLFVFEQYDRNLFEPVTIDPLTKIYRVKI